MAFPRELLADHEDLVFDLRPHWLALVGPTFWTLVSLAILIVGSRYAADRSWETTGQMAVSFAALLLWTCWPSSPSCGGASPCSCSQRIV